MRTDWDGYFIEIAKVVASRATCPRKAVGAVLVRDRNILSTGYNGSIRGTAHCTEVGCMMDNGSCVRTVHAEVNAISQAARAGTGIEGATIYCTYSPCWNCFKQIANAGIRRIVFMAAYHRGIDYLFGVPGVEVVHYQPPMRCIEFKCEALATPLRPFCMKHAPLCENDGTEASPCRRESCETCHPDE